MKIRYKHFQFKVESAEIKERNGIKVGLVKGYGATFNNIDRGGDRIMPGAFDITIAKHKERGRPIKMKSNHNKLIGGFPVFRTDDHGLFLEGEINLEVQEGKERYSLAKQGVLLDMSIGYYLNEFSIVKEGEKRVWNLEEIDVIETSLVDNPMNELANITGVKNLFSFNDFSLADKNYEWNNDTAIARLKEFIGSVSKPTSDFKNFFFHIDYEKADDFSAYKLPFCDIVEGELKAIPGAIIQAGAKLDDMGMSAKEKAGVLHNIEKYYKKMGIDSPFKKTISDISAYLKYLGLSNKEATQLIHDIKNISDRNDSEDISEADRKELAKSIDVALLNSQVNEVINKVKEW